MSLGRPAESRRRRAPAVVIALSLLVGALAPALVAVAAPSEAGRAVAAAVADDEARLELTSITPASARPSGRLTIRGNLVHPGGEPLRNVQIGLRVGATPLTSRGDLAQIASGTAPDRAIRTVPGTTTLAGEVTSGKVAPWQLSVPVRTLGLPGNGVYVLEVVATGRGGNGGETVRRLATLTTFLPYLPDQKLYQPTRLTWLWPLAATPARDAHGVFLDSATATEFTPGGRLTDLVNAPGRVQVTWMLDPELLETAQAMGRPHRTQNGRRATETDGNPDAARWFADLSGRLSGGCPGPSCVAALPYADPDVAALAHHGDPGQLLRAVARSKAATASALGRESDTTVAWPLGGLADGETLGAFRRAGAKTVVLSSASLVFDREPTYTPTGRARVDAEGAPLEVLVADQGLSDALAGDLSVPGSPAMAMQRFLAETALITLERPNQARTILVAPPRRWAPPAGWSGTLLDTVDRTPWVRTVSLSALSKTHVPAAYAGARLTYAPAAADAELSSAQVARMTQASTAATEVIRLLARPGPLETDYLGALFGSISTAWRDNRVAGRDYAGQVVDRINGDMGEVRILGRTLVTLSSTRGTIPLTVENALEQSIKVRPVLRPLVGSRLTVTNPGLITIGAGRKQTFQVPAEASANGITQVEVQLLDATGQPFGPATQLRVNVTSFGKVGLIVLIAAGSVLFGTAIVRNVRRVRHRSAESSP